MREPPWHQWLEFKGWGTRDSGQCHQSSAGKGWGIRDPQCPQSCLVAVVLCTKLYIRSIGRFSNNCKTRTFHKRIIFVNFVNWANLRKFVFTEGFSYIFWSAEAPDLRTLVFTNQGKLKFTKISRLWKFVVLQYVIRSFLRINIKSG